MQDQIQELLDTMADALQAGQQHAALTLAQAVATQVVADGDPTWTEAIRRMVTAAALLAAEHGTPTIAAARDALEELDGADTAALSPTIREAIQPLALATERTRASILAGAAAALRRAHNAA